jgi:hypothetical protein
MHGGGECSSLVGAGVGIVQGGYGGYGSGDGVNEQSRLQTVGHGGVFISRSKACAVDGVEHRLPSGGPQLQALAAPRTTCGGHHPGLHRQAALYFRMALAAGLGAGQ